MNAPLIVAHGDLLLPTIYPLAGTPLASYGEEWTLALARPALNEYEIPFYAAHFLTAYISPALHNDRSPYTPVSLWGKFKRNDLVSESIPPAQFTPPPVSPPPQDEPAPFAFEPFTAPEKHPVPAPPVNHNGRKQLAGGAIALACAAFIAWTLFGTKIGRPVAETSNETTALSTLPVAKQIGTGNPPEVSSVVDAPAAASAAAVTIARAPAAATAPAKAGESTVKLALADQPKPVPSANGVGSSTARSASNRPAKSSVAEQAASARPARTHVKAKTTARSKREEHRYAAAHRPHGGYLDHPTYRTAGRDEPLTPGGRRASARGETRANGYLSPAEMYSMLAHSPILDDNSNTTRASSRDLSAPMRPMTGPRADANGVQGWNAQLSQQRVTDAPTQFSK